MYPIRVLQVVTIMNRGGLETMLMNYYRQMDRSKVQFDFMVHRPDAGHYDDEIRSLGGSIFRMPQIRPGHYRQYFKRLDQFFIEHADYRVVHSHMNENSSFVLRAAKRAGVPCRIAHSHLSDLGLDFKIPFRLYARASMKDNPNQYFSCSRKAGEWLFGKKIAHSRQLTVLHNAVHVEAFAFNEDARQSVRNELGAGSELVIGHVGRFNEQKNHDFIIDIFKSVHERQPSSILVLAGDGHLKPAIQRKADNLGLTGHIRFLGVRNDINRLMQGMDLFLFPSLFEGLPVVMIEAQAAGLKCIVSDTITSESDVTGRVEFVGLQETAQEWSRRILTGPHDHADTSESLRRHGYDAATMAGWLADYYMNEGSIPS